MNKKAFTLLELLVVIAIVGFLLAVLLAAAGKVREGGRRSQCANNLRQHGMAWHLYLGDNDDYFPERGFYEGQADFRTFGGRPTETLPLPAERVLNHYLEIYDDSSPNMEVFHCPDDRDHKRSLTTFDRCGNSYIFNLDILLFGSPGGRPLSTITRSWNKLFLEMCAPGNYPGHGGRGNVQKGGGEGVGSITPVMVLFVDGHVGGPFLFDEDFETPNLIPDPEARVLTDPDGIPHN